MRFTANFTTSLQLCHVWRRLSIVEGRPVHGQTVQTRQEALAQCSIGVLFDPEGRRAMGHHDPGRQPGRYARSLDEPKNTTTPTVDSVTVGLHSLRMNCTQPQMRYFYSVSLVSLMFRITDRRTLKPDLRLITYMAGRDVAASIP